MEKIEKVEKVEKKEKIEKAKPPAKEIKDEVHAVSKLDIRVGKIVTVVVNTESEKLFNEEIDVGGGEIRKIASGLKGKVAIEDLQNSYVIVILNLCERTLCGWPSHGMVLCTTDSEGKVEPLRPAEGSQAGDLVTIGDYPRLPAPEVKKKVPWDLVKDDFFTNENKVAAFQKEHLWKTEKGFVTTNHSPNAKIN